VGTRIREPQGVGIGDWRRTQPLPLADATGDITARQQTSQEPRRVRAIHHYVKRLLDFSLALCALVLLSLLMLAIALVIMLAEGRPIFFQRTVIGWNGKRFGMWKFRSMVNGAEEMLMEDDSLYAAYQQSHFKLPHDPRVTRFGRILRKHSLDELPQLWNVVKGDMSLVGPRAIHPSERSLFGDFADKRETILPGMTGLWQVSGRSDTGYDERIRLDREYVEHCGLWLDIRILLRTAVVVIIGRGAY